jgi:hypothetical protein
MANSSIILTQLDFDSSRAALKTYLQQQDTLKDYDFDSSNIGVLLDILAYNTYMNTFYLNMIGSEMFLDSAQLRDSVVSHAKELNYLPRSFSSSIAKVNIVIKSSDLTKKSIVIPKGTAVLSRIGDDTFTFTTRENIVSSSSNGTFVVTDVDIYEGSYLSETYVVNYNNESQYKINNKTVDISSIGVTIIEDNGSVQYSYQRATSLFGHDSSSLIFFIQPSAGDTYEIVFGDGIVGRRPKNNSIVLIEYRTCNGELPNGAKTFFASGRIDEESDITFTTVSSATGGSVSESLESIKYNAPRAFTTQERAITAEDYENLLKTNFTEINAVAAYGGEDATPPQYGRIFLSVDLKDVDGLPKIKQTEYTNFLKSRSSVAMEPIFVSPDYIYLNVVSNVKYNINKTGLNREDIRTLVITAILNYASTNLNNFNKTSRYSSLVRAIDDANPSIVSNETDIFLVKKLVPNLNSYERFTIDFKTQLTEKIPLLSDEHPLIDVHAVSSSTFTYAGQSNCILEDNGDGIMRIVAPVGSNHKKIINVGTVDYNTGIINITNFNISSFEGTSLKVYATPRHKDISSSQNIILNIVETDIVTNIEQIRE